jgi:phosphate/sulfate permease
MENIYLLVVILLFGLAISDLIVGVSNDAVNFLNSSLGSKAAPKYIIMIIASLGIVVGATFSSGMMEVARKGIFNPEQFYFSEIMLIFLAVMLTDILLLDFFNTFALPTSTTVSIVFEILGAAVAISIVKLGTDAETASTLGGYINSSNALAIVGGILLSVIVAFILGSIVQFLVRLVFTFNFKKTIKYFGAIWGSVAVTAITYFIVIKGAKGSSLITEDALHWIKTNTELILIVSFVGWTIILQLLYLLTRFNIFKAVVLIGTFALAMAFAGNDLVNFIGVPVAGLRSFLDISSTAGADPDSYLMTALTGEVKTNTFILLIAGIIMVITLWLSKKARSVTETEINLSRQDEGYERFGSSGISRLLVRKALDFNSFITNAVPNNLLKRIQKRFAFNNEEEQKSSKDKKEEKAYFDLVRASVNLTVASIIISFATSLKLPLSTTYVTFMVAMGTSLSDRAWGRESAVYRITGVMTVIGGWFFTALVAFTVAFLIANLISWGGAYAVIALVILALVFLIKTHQVHKKREDKKQKLQTYSTEEFEDGNILRKCSTEIKETLELIVKIFNQTIEGVAHEDRKGLKKITQKVDQLNTDAKNIKNNVHHVLDKLQEDDIETGHYYVQVTDYLREMAHSLSFIAHPSHDHIANQHKSFNNEQIKELLNLNKEITLLFTNAIHIINTEEYKDLPKTVFDQQQKVLGAIASCRKAQIKRIKKKKTGTKNSILYLQLLNEIKNFSLHTGNLIKSQRDFITYHEKPELEN